MTDREVLEMFLKCRLNSPKEVFAKFLTLENAKYYEYQGYPICVYIAGKREDRVLLVAHADTVWNGQNIGNSRIVLIDGADIYLLKIQGIHCLLRTEKKYAVVEQ